MGRQKCSLFIGVPSFRGCLNGGVSQHLYSVKIIPELFQGCVSVFSLPHWTAEALSITVDSTTATSISLSWTISTGSEVTSYEVTWQLSGSDVIFSATLTGSATGYTVEGLESGSIYSITVTATTTSGTVAGSPLLVSTLMEGESYTEEPI